MGVAWWLAIIDLVGWTLVVVSGFKTRNHHTVFVVLMASAGVRSLAIFRAATRVRPYLMVPKISAEKLSKMSPKF